MCLPGGSLSCHNDCYEMDIRSAKWRRLPCSSGLPPCTRPTTVLHDNRVTLFGGCDGESNFLNGTLELRLESPSLKELCREWLREMNCMREVVAGEVSADLEGYLAQTE